MNHKNNKRYNHSKYSQKKIKRIRKKILVNEKKQIK